MNKFLKILKSIPKIFQWRKIHQHFISKKYNYSLKELENMKVNIIYPKHDAGWIIYKFAKTVYDELTRLNVEATLSNDYDPSANINHFFVPNIVDEKGIKSYGNISFMITHVDTMFKLDRIKELTNKGSMGICMSKDTRDKLIASGVKRDHICYINPAQDGQIMPKKIALGFTNRVYNDNRKRESMLIDVCKQVDNRIFKIKIMGAGWDNIVSEISQLGFEIEYYPEFDKEKYNQLIESLDYYCYFGTDEGSMGFLDAVAAGIGTIVTPQGYHLDTNCGITYPVNTVDEIVDVLHEIEYKRKKHIKFVETWTWNNYTKKHLEIWQYMLQCEPLDILLKNRGCYMDGIFSLMLKDLNNYKSIKEKLSEM